MQFDMEVIAVLYEKAATLVCCLCTYDQKEIA